MTDPGFEAVTEQLLAAAADYRAALGADLTVTGSEYEQQARAYAYRLIEHGRRYEAAADDAGLTPAQRLPWVGYLLMTSGPVMTVTPNVVADVDDSTSAAEEAEPAAASGMPEVVSLLRSAISVLAEADSVDRDAWRAIKSSTSSDEGELVGAPGTPGASRAATKQDQRVTELMDSQNYRDELKENLERAMAWIQAGRGA